MNGQRPREVAALKAKLSEYLRDVRHGETVLITDRGQVVAQLVPPGPIAALALPEVDRERQQLLAEGVFCSLGTQQQDDWPAMMAVAPFRGPARFAKPLRIRKGGRVV